MFDAHLRDEDLEQYILNILPDEKVPAFEEHLLGCPACAKRAEEMEIYIELLCRLLERKPN